MDMNIAPSFHLRDAFYLIAVAALWGTTNSLIKKHSKGIEKIESNGKFAQIFLEFKFLITNWKYLLSFLANQSGSVLYYVTLSTADLTLAVPITNSLTFIFTAISGHFLGEKRLDINTVLGASLVTFGVLLCVLSKVDLPSS